MAFIEIVEQRYYQSVDANTIVNNDYVIVDGSMISLEEIGGNAAGSMNDTRVEIVWDPMGENEILIATIGDVVQKSFRELIGDGEKIIRVSLINNTDITKTLGGYFIAKRWDA